MGARSKEEVENYMNAFDDAEYDSLMKELLEIEKKRPEIKRGDSPTDNVGGLVTETFSEVEHDPPMLSLGNVFDTEELNKYVKSKDKRDFNIDELLDNLSWNLIINKVE
jgi:NAD-dependent DNA ligase